MARALDQTERGTGDLRRQFRLGGRRGAVVLGPADHRRRASDRGEVALVAGVGQKCLHLPDGDVGAQDSPIAPKTSHNARSCARAGAT